MRTALPPFLVLAWLLACIGGASARVDIEVDLSRQAMRVDSAEGSFVWPISSGRFGYNTPRGSYRIGRMELMHRSRRYDNAPMPNAMFFHGGYAIHGTYAEGALGSPASHGCIRLSREDAAHLYGLVQREGGRVTIVGTSPQDADRPRRQRASRRAAPFWDDDGFFEPEPDAYPAYPRRGWRQRGWDNDDFGF